MAQQHDEFPPRTTDTQSASMSDGLRRLRAYLRRRLGSQADADDVAQEAWLRLWSRRDGADRQDGNPQALLFHVARNIAIDRQRARQRWQTVPDDEAPVRTDDRTPERAVAARQELAVVLQAMQLLPELQQRALALHAQGLPHAEIGAALGVSRRLATYHIARGLAALNRARREACGEADGDMSFPSRLSERD